jgi:hypothetical protein
MKLLFSLLLVTASAYYQALAQNTVYGYNAGTYGLANTHIGAFTGQSNIHGYDNTFVGYNSGARNTTGYYNTFLGHASGYRNTTGIQNTFVGSGSGNSNTIGKSNTFLGNGSGSGNTTGNNNTFLGYNSGVYNNFGNNNIFLGYYSGYSSTAGNSNIFLGSYSGYNNTNGNYNIFLGDLSGRYNTTGAANIFLGNSSGYSNLTGYRNLFLGNYSGHSNATGYDNTFLGYYSGLKNNGARNVFIGYMAGYSETGSNKFYIDNNDDIGPLLYGDFIANTLSIGTKYTGTAYSLVAPGKVRASAYDVVFDERLKENVQRMPNALTKVNRVEGISYRFKADTGEISQQSTTAKKLQYGFLANNIQEVFPELVTEDQGMLSMNYQGMIPVLVEAIKSLSLKQDSMSHLQVQLTQVQQKNQQLEQQNQQLTTELQLIKQALQANGLLKTSTKPAESSISPTIFLFQNEPNPFTETTTITYQVSIQAREVSLILTTLTGNQVQVFHNLSAGTGEVSISGGSLAAGTYVYSLVVDGQIVASKQMLLTK